MNGGGEVRIVLAGEASVAEVASGRWAALPSRGRVLELPDGVDTKFVDG